MKSGQNKSIPINQKRNIFPMYREPHLQRKSDKCAALWREWYNYKFGLKDEEKAKEYRELWGKCVDEHSKMIQAVVNENPIYNTENLL